MASYGWQIFKADGSLNVDNSVIMSRRLGFYDIPLITDSRWSAVVNNVPFNNGTPFAHCEVIPGFSVPSGDYQYWAPIFPNIDTGANYVRMWYDPMMWAFFQDDVGLGTFYAGMIRVHYGVYNK